MTTPHESTSPQSRPLRRGGSTCPACGQPLREQRLGVWFPPRKAEIIDTLRDAGDGGLTQRALADRFHLTLDAIRSHVYQINELLAGTDCFIRSMHRQSQAGYEIIYCGREAWEKRRRRRQGLARLPDVL